MRFIKDNCTNLIIYLFMLSALTSMFCFLFLVVFLFRYAFESVSEQEQTIAYYFFIILLVGLLMVPISLFILERIERIKD